MTYQYRPLTVLDLPAAVALFAETLPEQMGPLAYPALGEQGLDEYARSLALQLTGNPNWFAIGAVQEGTLVAFVSATLSRRAIGTPKCICFGELVVVSPAHRNHDLARHLVQSMADEGWRRGADVLECGWAPDSLGSLVWPTHGLKPYRILGAWVLGDGTPRRGVPAP